MDHVSKSGWRGVTLRRCFSPSRKRWLRFSYLIPRDLTVLVIAPQTANLTPQTKCYEKICLRWKNKNEMKPEKKTTQSFGESFCVKVARRKKCQWREIQIGNRGKYKDFLPSRCETLGRKNPPKFRIFFIIKMAKGSKEFRRTAVFFPKMGEKSMVKKVTNSSQGLSQSFEEEKLMKLF